jgi:hypothetical protein
MGGFLVIKNTYKFILKAYHTYKAIKSIRDKFKDLNNKNLKL